MIRKLIYLILVTMLAGAVMAQDVSLRADHPDEYIVVRGDTLWDISGRFLNQPWQWPAIWHANQQIENPHLIYPGDKISLVYIDGAPRLMVDRGKPEVRLSPNMRTVERESIGAFPTKLIKPFIEKARIISAEDYATLPYVIKNFETRINATVGDRTYARGITGAVGEKVTIVRLSNIYYRLDGEKKRARDSGPNNHVTEDLTFPQGFWRPVNTWGKTTEIIGYEMWQVAEATILKIGDPAILQIDAGRTEVQEGDLILPIDEHVMAANFMPRAMSAIPDNLKVLAIEGGHYGVGHYQMLSISGGSNQGVEPGHVFSAFRPGEIVNDDVGSPTEGRARPSAWDGEEVQLPDEYDAHIMVFRVFDEVSYAMVMDGDRPVRMQDVLRHPDEEL